MPDFLGIDVAGLKPLMDKLAKMPEAVQEEATRAAADELITVMRVYPPQRPTKYIRTFKLRDNWVIIGQGKNEMIVNTIPYGGYVMGDAEQAWMHKGFWKTVGTRIEQNSQKLAKVLQSAADKALRKLGLK